MVEASRSWVANCDAEPGGIADVEAELDFRNESLPFHLVGNELVILRSGHRGSRVIPPRFVSPVGDKGMAFARGGCDDKMRDQKMFERGS